MVAAALADGRLGLAQRWRAARREGRRRAAALPAAGPGAHVVEQRVALRGRQPAHAVLARLNSSMPSSPGDAVEGAVAAGPHREGRRRVGSATQVLRGARRRSSRSPGSPSGSRSSAPSRRRGPAGPGPAALDDHGLVAHHVAVRHGDRYPRELLWAQRLERLHAGEEATISSRLSPWLSVSSVVYSPALRRPQELAGGGLRAAAEPRPIVALPAGTIVAPAACPTPR